MSTFNMTNNTNSKIKDVSLAFVLIGFLLVALTVSTRANAAPATSVENAISNFIVAQGEKMIVDLNTQLQQSINKEIKTFSANFSLKNATTWLEVDQQVKQATLAQNNQNKTTAESTNESVSQPKK
ncbi:hypothetical protein [Colwellia piezophila]|uniref:hypothetical protein n=1 Tax=Colwellia piezophila TaxID=211668 RepID=UPI000379BE50|nr:hypothetical protein [Colwellia piezophila]